MDIHEPPKFLKCQVASPTIRRGAGLAQAEHLDQDYD